MFSCLNLKSSGKSKAMSGASQILKSRKASKIQRKTDLGRTENHQSLAPVEKIMHPSTFLSMPVRIFRKTFLDARMCLSAALAPAVRTPTGNAAQPVMSRFVNPPFLLPALPTLYMPCMPTYIVLPRQRQPGYKVALVGDNGTRQTILGFNSEAEAEIWVAEDKRLEVFRQFSQQTDQRVPSITQRHRASLEVGS